MAHPPRIRLTRIGVDLDNTLINYTEAYARLAPRFGVSNPRATRNDVRAALRLNDDDDEDWQRFQSLLYTEGLKFATPAEGVIDFLSACSSMGVAVHIVSHKTSHSPERFGSLDLRTPALDWIRRHSAVLAPLSAESVTFAPTIEEKVSTISSLNLDAFVDDLPKVLNQPTWPAGTLGILYIPGPWKQDGVRWCAGFATLAEWILLQGNRSRE